MKTRYISIALAAACTFAIGCSKENPMTLDEIQLSSSYVAINPDGGSVKVTVTANVDWTLDFDVPVPADSLSSEKGVIKYNEYKKQMSLDENKWITVSTLSGSAGTTELVFSAEAAESSRKSSIRIKAGDRFQNVIVAQTKEVKHEVTPLSKVVTFTSADDGKVLRVCGACTAIASTSYGNFYIQDEDGNEVYIYGTVDDGGAYNWSKFNIEIGDKVTVEGPYSNYKGTHELVDALFISVEKSLLSSKDVNKVIEKTADPFTVTLTQKGVGLTSESQTEWLTLGNGYSTDSKGNLVFEVTPTANTTGKARTGTLKFVSTKIEKKDTLVSILMVSVKQLATDKPQTESTLSAIATAISASSSSSNPVEFDVIVKDATVTYVNGSNAIVEDANGGLLFYGCDLKVGQVINGRIYGSGYAYNKLPEVTVLGLDFATVTELPKKPEARVVAFSELYANFSKYVSTYIKVTDAKAGDKIDVTYKVVSSKGNLTDDTNTIDFNHQSTGKYGKDKIYYYIQIEKGAALEVTCVPSVFKTSNQLNIFEQKWISEKK